ncbi:MAG: hypothetical protein U1B80_07160, partial [Anaerolineaceae bacterium]|nr:hypothetical protein [Anaerolineaceae bacterium]
MVTQPLRGRWDPIPTMERNKMLRRWGLELLLFLFVPVCISGILLFLNPTFLRQIAIALRFSFTIVFPLLVFLFFLAFSLPRKWGKAVAVVVIVSVYSLALLGVWASGFSDTYILSGLLPISDASGYYSNTLRFPLVGQFTEFASRRPLFNSLLTSISVLTNYNFVLIQSILVLIMGIACTYAALAVRDSYGSLPAALVAVLLLFYFRRFIGFFSSETLGLGLGASGFVFLWRSAVLRSHKYFFPGIFLCSLGLITRAGAFLVLPMLVLWGAIFLGKRAKQRIWVAASGIIIIIAAFLMNTALYQLYGAPEAASFSNYAYSLYGLATGGLGWKQVLIDHR